MYCFIVSPQKSPQSLLHTRVGDEKKCAPHLPYNMSIYSYSSFSVYIVDSGNARVA